MNTRQENVSASATRGRDFVASMAMNNLSPSPTDPKEEPSSSSASPTGNTTRHLRVLTVDDEPLARIRLTSLLASDPELEIIAQCGSTAEALLVERVKPRVTGRSRQMPEYAILRDSSAELGDFVFFRSK